MVRSVCLALALSALASATAPVSGYSGDGSPLSFETLVPLTFGGKQFDINVVNLEEGYTFMSITSPDIKWDGTAFTAGTGGVYNAYLVKGLTNVRRAFETSIPIPDAVYSSALAMYFSSLDTLTFFREVAGFPDSKQSSGALPAGLDSVLVDLRNGLTVTQLQWVKEETAINGFVEIAPAEYVFSLLTSPRCKAPPETVDIPATNIDVAFATYHIKLDATAKGDVVPGKTTCVLANRLASTAELVASSTHHLTVTPTGQALVAVFLGGLTPVKDAGIIVWTATFDPNTGNVVQESWVGKDIMQSHCFILDYNTMAPVYVAPSLLQYPGDALTPQLNLMPLFLQLYPATNGNPASLSLAVGLTDDPVMLGKTFSFKYGGTQTSPETTQWTFKKGGIPPGSDGDPAIYATNINIKFNDAWVPTGGYWFGGQSYTANAGGAMGWLTSVQLRGMAGKLVYFGVCNGYDWTAITTGETAGPLGICMLSSDLTERWVFSEKPADDPANVELIPHLGDTTANGVVDAIIHAEQTPGYLKWPGVTVPTVKQGYLLIAKTPTVKTQIPIAVPVPVDVDVEATRLPPPSGGTAPVPAPVPVPVPIPVPVPVPVPVPIPAAGPPVPAATVPADAPPVPAEGTAPGATPVVVVPSANPSATPVPAAPVAAAPQGTAVPAGGGSGSGSGVVTIIIIVIVVVIVAAAGLGLFVVKRRGATREPEWGAMEDSTL